VVEHFTDNEKVVGSIPTTRTSAFLFCLKGRRSDLLVSRLTLGAHRACEALFGQKKKCYSFWQESNVKLFLK
jgi:hypothetical protein